MFTFIIYSSTASLLIRFVTVCSAFLPPPASSSSPSAQGELRWDDVLGWTSGNVREELLLGLKSGSFNMMENVFAVTVRCNICLVCKSASLLSSGPVRKAQLRQPRYICVWITFPHKTEMWWLWRTDEDLEQFASERNLHSVFVFLPLLGVSLTRNSLQLTTFSSGSLLSESSSLLVINAD